jgi:small subunit ribosomal protein S1
MNRINGNTGDYPNNHRQTPIRHEQRNGQPTRSANGDLRFAQAPPPPPDENYWAALLREGELTHRRPAGAPSSQKPPVPATYQHYHENQHDLEGEGLEPAPRVNTAESQRDWQEVARVFANDLAIDLPVIGYNRGGLLMEWGELRGFVPASQLVDFPPLPDGPLRRAELALRVGNLIRLRVIELDPEQNRLILSERAAMVQPGTRADVLDRLLPNHTAQGRVTNLCDFGVFVDLGGVEGLIHISELSWGRVNHPKDILSRGELVQVYVIDIDRADGRVALSMKRLQPDPWAAVEQRYAVGQVIQVEVTNVVDFGAFARIEEGLEGLIHISELSEQNFAHPRHVLTEGSLVWVRILNIDGRSRRLGLSLRGLEQR